jgi:hypothetical protein
MDASERLALHQRMADGYFDAYANFNERNGRVLFPDDWSFAEEMVYFSPFFTGGRDYVMGRQLSAGLDWNDSASKEASVYSAALPGWRATSHKTWVSTNGFAIRTNFAGQSRDGQKYEWLSVELIDTNDEGQIVHNDCYLEGFGAVTYLAFGVAGPFRSFGVYWSNLMRRYEDLQKRKGA